MTKQLLITVNYNSFQDTIDYLDSLRKIENFIQLEIIIADNSPSAINFNKINDWINNNRLENIKIIHTGKNLGYFGAAKYILDYKILDQKKYEFIIVSNNDIIIKDDKILEKITRKIGEADILAPQIISLQDNINQNPFLEIKGKIKNKIFHSLYYSGFFMAKLTLYLRKFLLLAKQKKFIRGIERKIYSAHGSFLIFSKSFFEKGGYIDDGFFLYAEESTLAETIIQIGGSILYVPTVVVYHKSNGTTDKGLTKQKYDIQKNAHQYFMEKYRNS